MSFLGKGKKEDLNLLAIELGEDVPENSKVIDLKKIITETKNFEDNFVKVLFMTIIDNRNKKLERVHEIKMKELEIQSMSVKEKDEISVLGSGDGSEGIGYSFLGYLNIMRRVVLEPPEKTEEWPFFFYHAERIFKLYEVPI